MKNALNKPLKPSIPKPPPLSTPPPTKPSVAPSRPSDISQEPASSGDFSDQEFEERFGGKNQERLRRPVRPRTTTKKLTTAEKKAIDVRMGRGYKQKGKRGLDWQLSTVATGGKRLRYLSKEDRKKFSKLVSGRARKGPAGGELSKKQKAGIKMKIERMRRKGEFSEADANALKKIVGTGL